MGGDSVRKWLDQMGDRTLVGVGGATHGTREFVQLKQWLIRDLIRESGVRTIAFEADSMAMHQIDAAIRGAGQHPREVLNRVDEWMWQTQSIASFLEWVWKFNNGRSTRDQIRIHGIDLPELEAAVIYLDSYLESIDSQEVRSSTTTTNTLETELPDGKPPYRDAELDAVVSAVQAVRDRLADQPMSPGERPPSHSVAFACYLCDVITRTCEWYRVRFEQAGPHKAGMAFRDEAMAANVDWCVEHDNGEGVVVWAHNSHIQRGCFDDGTAWTDATTLGQHLTEEYGARYESVGFDFGQGRFRAIDGGSSQSSDPEVFGVGPPIEESATTQFLAVDELPAVFDFGDVTPGSSIDSWVGKPRRIRRIGSVYDPEAPAEQYYLETRLDEAFDAIIVIKESSPTRSLQAR